VFQNDRTEYLMGDLKGTDIPESVVIDKNNKDFFTQE
jgi:hypothetical protein